VIHQSEYVRDQTRLTFIRCGFAAQLFCGYILDKAMAYSIRVLDAEMTCKICTSK